MKTAVVILNWNGKGYLEKFLPGLLESVEEYNQTYDGRVDGFIQHGRAEVIVADNASTDGSIEMMRERFPQVPLLCFDKNYGFTGGYNKAFKEIQAQYYLLLNSDVEVEGDWLSPLVEWMDTHHLCGACAPKLHSYQDKEMFEYAGAAGGLIDKYGYPFCRGRILKKVEKDYGQYDEPDDVFWVSGACLMVRSELYHRLGGLDERFFAHFEEIDLCWRIQLEGYNVTVIPDSTVWHVGGGSLPAESPWKFYLNYRNNLLMLSNNLAKSRALELYNEDQEDCVRKGMKSAQKTIFARKVLDGLSAAVYLLTFRWKYFKAVLKAHKDYGSLASSPSAEEIEAYLEEKGKMAGVNGIYDGSIILQSFLHGDRMFRMIQSEGSLGEY